MLGRTTRELGYYWSRYSIATVGGKCRTNVGPTLVDQQLMLQCWTNVVLINASTPTPPTNYQFLPNDCLLSVLSHFATNFEEGRIHRGYKLWSW